VTQSTLRGGAADFLREALPVLWSPAIGSWRGFKRPLRPRTAGGCCGAAHSGHSFTWHMVSTPRRARLAVSARLAVCSTRLRLVSCFKNRDGFGAGPRSTVAKSGGRALLHHRVNDWPAVRTSGCPPAARIVFRDLIMRLRLMRAAPLTRH
jgi:hypothetical protein